MRRGPRRRAPRRADRARSPGADRRPAALDGARTYAAYSGGDRARTGRVDDEHRRGRGAGKIFGVHPLTEVRTKRREVALIVRTAPGRLSRPRRRLAASWNSRDLRRRGSRRHTAKWPRSRRARRRDGLLPEAPHSSFLHWLGTRGQLRRQANALDLGHHYYYLPPRGGADLGQLVMAPAAGLTPVNGAYVLHGPAVSAGRCAPATSWWSKCRRPPLPPATWSS